MLWIKNVLKELEIKPKKSMRIYCDNKRATSIAI